MIGRVDAAGTVDTTTATVAITGGNPRSVASSDGNTFWIVGSVVGVQAATLGNAIVSTVSTTTTNLREVNIFGGQLYLSTGSLSNFRIGAVGSGLPVTSGQTTVTCRAFRSVLRTAATVSFSLTSAQPLPATTRSTLRTMD